MCVGLFVYSALVFHVFNVFTFYIGLLIVRLCFMSDIVFSVDSFIDIVLYCIVLYCKSV